MKRDDVNWAKAECLWHEGWTATAIADRYCVSLNTVLRGARKRGWPPKACGRPRYDWAKARELWDQEMPGGEIAAIIGCPPKRLYDVAYEQHWPTRRESHTRHPSREGASRPSGIDWTHVAQDELFGSHGEDEWRALTKEQKWAVLYRARELAGIPALKERYDPRGKMWGTECATPTCSRRTKSRTGYCDECRADSDRQRQEAA